MKMGKQAKKQQTSGQRTVTEPDGTTKVIQGTKAGRKRGVRQYGDPARTHDGPKFRSNPKRFDRGKKITNLDPSAQMKRTGGIENPYN